MNQSKQRDIILKLLQGTKVHPSAEWVYEEARKVLPNISLATVYRNLAQLLEAGMIVKVADALERVRYDGCTIPHAHFVCSSCGEVFDIDISAELDSLIRRGTDMNVTNYGVTYNGYCNACSETNNKQ